MSYVLHSEKITAFPPLYSPEQDYVQLFQHGFTNNISREKIVSDYTDGKTTKRDLAILRFVLQFRFVRFEELHEYLSLLGYLTKDDGTPCSPNILRNRLDRLVEGRLLNRFILAHEEDGPIPSDVLSIYCLDLGGRFLLEHFAIDIEEWRTVDNFKRSDIINRDLLLSSLYINMVKACGVENILEFHRSPVLQVWRGVYIPSFSCTVQFNGEARHFVGEIIRSRDTQTIECTPPTLPKQAQRLSSFVNSQFWKRRFPSSSGKSPIAFIICEEESQLLNTAQFFDLQGVERMRLSTDSNIQGELATAFYSYNAEIHRISAVKSAIFSKK